MELIHPRSLRTFVVLAEELHFGRAAQRLGCSQSTVSEQLRNLEKDLGVVLFERHSRGVSLTDAGRRLIDPAGHLLGEHARFVQLARSGSDAEDRITLGAAPGAMPLVAQIAEAVAGTGIELTVRVLTVPEGLRALAAAEITTMLLGVVDGLSMPGVEQITLARTEVAVVMTPTHPLARLDRVERALLIGHQVGVPTGFLALAERLLEVDRRLPELTEYTSMPHSMGELLGGDRVALHLVWFHRWWRDLGLVDRVLSPEVTGTMSLLYRTALSGPALANVERLARLTRSLMP